MNTPQKREMGQWLSEEWGSLKSDKDYRLSVIILAASLIVACIFTCALWGREKLVIAVAAGFIVVAEGVIDFFSELSPGKKKRLQGYKLLYRILGVAAAIGAIAVEK